MNDVRLDPILEQWLGDGPVKGPEHGLERALAATRNARQQSRWEFRRMWLPAPVAEFRLPRIVMIGLLLAMTIAVLISLAIAFGSRLALLPRVLGPADQVIAYADGGVIYRV